jgi:hypothetical protein
MTERQPRGSVGRTAGTRPPRSWARRHEDSGTVPNIAPVYLTVEPDPTLLGFPAEVVDGDDDTEPPVTEADGAPAPIELVVVRRADPIAAAALVLAGVAANVSLVLSWAPDEGPTGLTLVRRGVEALSAGEAPSGAWQPPVVVAAGFVLVLLGFLMLAPTRGHRLVGVLSLTVALAAAAAVILLIADLGLTADQFGPGMWCAVAVPVLGVLGAMKAMLTAPRVTLGPR